MPELPIIDRALRNAHRTAIVDSAGPHSYQQLLDASAAIARSLLADEHDLRDARVAFLISPGFNYAAVQWGIWRAGGIAVPLALSHPAPELHYTVTDAIAEILVVEAALADRVARFPQERGIRMIDPEPVIRAGVGPVALPAVDAARRAMIVYTSGTTGRPKGVVSTHAGIQAQIEMLVTAWEWSEGDHTLLVLPLHHVHGIVNVLACALWSGARCTVHPGFDPEAVWDEIVAGDLTLFMAVPTIYTRLAQSWERADLPRRSAMSAGCARMRLMVSGSAALPVALLERWRAISGHTLLERYGMTEIGMALSNPLAGERSPGRVGAPLPGVEVRIVDDSGVVLGDGVAGELEVTGPGVFLEYWRRPVETERSFRDGWFRTGDVADRAGGVYRILGRTSIDILKTAGFKLSALEVEEVLRTHPDIEECAVLGIADEELGERVAAAIILSPAAEEMSLAELRDWMSQQLAPYKLPRSVRFVSELPRNAMGKVLKAELRRLF